MVACVSLVLCFASPVSAETLGWIRQLGSGEFDRSLGVSADGLGYVYITGYTFGNLVGTNAGRDDAFFAKYDTSGILQWTQQPGTSEIDRNNGVSADGLGNVYISGRTAGSLGGPNSGDRDAFIAKFGTSMLEPSGMVLALLTNTALLLRRMPRK
ncbi:unnamed protein product [marine sediment metagenome]|uniref:Beta-propeller repeat protein n=1 Tax=marine sediment metagenome TaxID=412755 RepID=X0SRY5_9ZZZZ